MPRTRLASLALASLLVVSGLAGSALASAGPANVERADTTAGASQAALHIPSCPQTVLHCVPPPSPPTACTDSNSPTDLFATDCDGTDWPVIGPHWVEVTP